MLRIIVPYRGDGVINITPALARILFLIAACAYTLPSFGACNPMNIEYVKQRFGSSGINGPVEFVNCKAHPEIKNATIVAIASIQSELLTEVAEDYDLEIVLVNTKNNTILAQKLYKAKLTNGGGPRFTGIEIDTAKYFVAPGIRAFGIRAHFNMSFTFSQELSLFFIKGNKVREILSGAETEIFFTNRWSACTEETREEKRTLRMGKERTNGFYDLLVTGLLVDSREHTDSFGNCVNRVIHKETKKYRLKYDGTQYVIPNEILHFDCRVC